MEPPSTAEAVKPAGARRPSDAPRRAAETLNIGELKDMSIAKLTQIAKDLNVTGATGMRKQELIFQILKAQTEQSGFIFSEGVLEVLPDGFGFLRAPDYNYLPGPDDIYVSPSQIRKFDLQTGDTVSGQIRPPKEGERYFALIKVEAVNFEPPEQARDKIFFENLTPLYPQERLQLESEGTNLSARVMDLMTPIGKGPARAHRGRPANRQDDAAAEHREVHRQESLRGVPHRAPDRRAPRGSDGHAALGRRRGGVIDLRRAGPSGTCRWPRWSSRRPSAWSSTAKDVVILLDSVTRLARAYNTVIPALGQGAVGRGSTRTRSRSRSGSSARRGTSRRAARSRSWRRPWSTPGRAMDDVIFEEFKGTGNMEIHLERKLVDKRVFPAIDIQKERDAEGRAAARR